MYVPSIGWVGPNVTSHSTPDEQANNQLSVKEKAGVMKPPKTPNNQTKLHILMTDEEGRMKEASKVCNEWCHATAYDQ